MLTSPAKAILLGLLCTATAQAGPLQIGDKFPDLATYKLEGTLPADLAGKVVIVDFWASWCAPCKASFPVLEELHQKFADRGVVILAINVDDKRTAMEGFLKEHRATFPIVRDAAKQLVAAANIATMPTSFILDRTGHIRAVHNGFHGDKTKQQYLAEIEALLK